MSLRTQSISRSIALFALCLLAVSGCTAAKQKANALAEQAVYKPVEYANASIPGPAVVVLPGTFSSRAAEYAHTYCHNSIRDFAELELSKANFTVLEHADQLPLFEEIALAANMGDASAVSAFRKDGLDRARYFMVFNINKAEPIKWEQEGGDGRLAGILLGLGVTLLTGSSGLGDSTEAALSSIHSYNSNATWSVHLAYKVVDAETSAIVDQGEFSDQSVASTETSGALGISETTSCDVTVDTLVQRLVQKAVADLDGKFKAPPQALAQAPESSKKKKKKSAKGLSKKERQLAEAYAQKVAEHKLAQDKEAAVQTLRAFDFAMSNMDGGAMVAVSSPTIHEELGKELLPMFKRTRENSPNWRNSLVWDFSGLDYEIISFDPEKCTIHKTGKYRMGSAKKLVEMDSDDKIDLVKQDGHWKVATVGYTFKK